MLSIQEIHSRRTSDNNKSHQRAFTIIELIVVISVIGILASISAISYGSWQQSLNTTQVKSDLNGAKSAMENARNFSTSGGYPVSVASIFTASKDTNMSGGSTDSGKTVLY